MINYLNAITFQQSHPKAYGKWCAAEELLWKSDSQNQLTTIGHLCREAGQEFADDLVKHYQPPDVTTDKTKTKDRLKAVIRKKVIEVGETKESFYDALIAYWYTLIDLVQRQEHAGLKEGQPLTWEDGRIVVFNTLIVMFEIDKAL